MYESTAKYNISVFNAPTDSLSAIQPACGDGRRVLMASDVRHERTCMRAGTYGRGSAIYVCT